ncbi:serine hydrolase [Legionella hackeliae]|uniref:Putative peptidase n=1 Tax=Legionella hackeliae TaxID=449 RepID=A0A0A8UX45_LEGHA|nr:serine hydrolase [Legionella hackeliae]KTD15298.1 beta-lactamase [Legionella hackeliae]CEK11334.1 putative peptidase [Legionella hackeliae]STX48106.1 beta-lactamase [Legionella hackeliae]
MISTALTGRGRGDFRVHHHGQSIDDLIISYMEHHQIPGMSLAIVQAPYITRVVGYGIANTESRQLVSMNSAFNIGQLTNAFTAVALMQLKEAKQLTLQDKISQYLPDIPSNWQSITIHDLLTHSSGIPSYAAEAGFDYSKHYSSKELIALVSEKPLLFAPGTQMNNSATDYYLLGLVIEKVSGMSYEAFVTINQIERIGLKNTFFISTKDKDQNEVANASSTFKHSKFLQESSYINPTEQAQGYTEVDGQLKPSVSLDWSTTFADSGIVSSAGDISFWDIALAGNILVSDPANRQFLYNPVLLGNKTTPGNANWFFPGHPGLMEIKGQLPGYSAFLSRFTAPTELLCVTLLANKDNLSDLDILARKIAAAFDGKLGVPYGSSWSETMESPYSVETTLDRISKLVSHQGGTIFGRVDHSEAAEKVGLALNPTQVLIIGNPAKGTALMQANPAFALDLPLRIMATKGAAGEVWLSYTDPLKLSKEYNLDKEQASLVKQMSNGLSRLCHKAISPDDIG